MVEVVVGNEDCFDCTPVPASVSPEVRLPGVHGQNIRQQEMT